MRQPVAIPNTVQQRVSAYNKSHGSNQVNEAPMSPSDYRDRKENDKHSFPPRSVTPGQKRAPTNGTPNSKRQPYASRNSTPSPLGLQRRQVRSDGTNSLVSSGSGAAADWQQDDGLDLQEQALFEQRLCEDEYGVAVRKINQNGKSSLRYIKCMQVDLQDLDDDGPMSSNRSVGSLSRGSLNFMRGLTSKLRSDRSVSGRSRSERSLSGRSVERNELRDLDKLLPGATLVRVLTWGKKKDVKIPLERFVAVRKGKTTDRTRRNMCTANRILSLITNDPYHPSLDIEAPTRLDRDKFARAFSKFLKVPLDAEENRSTRSDFTPSKVNERLSKTDHMHNPKQFPLPVVTMSSSPNRLPPQHNPHLKHDRSKAKMAQKSAAKEFPNTTFGLGNLHTPAPALGKASSPGHKGGISSPSSRQDVHAAEDDGSAVSSITGAGFDQEIVEEMHMAMTALRAELEESRAEATRAVKVAEQAIQSAEKSNSKDWNSTVTHKAAEAAALAQKKSAEAMSRARLAEERLQTERQNASVWKTQAQAAEEEAGYWQTRAAAAEVDKAAIAESLESERANIITLLASTRGKNGFESDDKRNRALEAEVNIMQSTLSSKDATVKALRECLVEVETTPEAYQILKKNPNFMHKMQNAKSLSTSNAHTQYISPNPSTTQSEVERLRSKVARETAMRRNLLHEVQDLRGAVRVYCRLKASTSGVSVLSIPSNEVVQLHRENAKGSSNTTPLGFEFDGVITPDMDQQDIYREVEDVCLNALDGYSACIMTYGQSRSGKTFTMLGDIKYSTAADSIEPILSLNNFGIHLRAARQIFSVSKQRRDRYKDVVTFSVVEVHEERLYDLLVGTDIGESQGRQEMHRKGRRRGGSVGSSSSAMGHSDHPSRLEIKTNHNGETIVIGLLSVEVKSFEDICRVWKECLSRRVSRLAEQGLMLEGHDQDCHIIGTMRIFSTNQATGIGTQGKIQFVDLAASDILHEPCSTSTRRTPSPDVLSSIGRDLKFANKSIAALSEVVEARSRYQRSVPYRNSTITHLLSDSLEADTKVVMIACVSTDAKDIQETACTLKFAQAMRKVIVGKATKHSLRHN